MPAQWTGRGDGAIFRNEAWAFEWLVLSLCSFSRKVMTYLSLKVFKELQPCVTLFSEMCHSPESRELADLLRPSPRPQLQEVGHMLLSREQGGKGGRLAWAWGGGGEGFRASGPQRS